METHRENDKEREREKEKMKFIWSKSTHRKGIYEMVIIAFHRLLDFWALTEHIRMDQRSAAFLYYHQPSTISHRQCGRREGKKNIKVKIIILYFL